MAVSERKAGNSGWRLLRARGTAAAWLLAATLATATLGAGTTGAQQTTSTTLSWYTQQQADAGRRAFNTSCAACHGYSMFTRFLNFRTAERYYNKMSGSMPRWAPGSLPEEDYVNILAYLLQETGFPPGEELLTSERARLRQIVLPSPTR